MGIMVETRERVKQPSRKTCAYASKNSKNARNSKPPESPLTFLFEDFRQKLDHLLPRPDSSNLHHPPPRPVPKLGPAGIDDKTALSKSGETPARERVTRRTRALDCGSTHRWSGCVSFIIIVSRHPEHQRGHRPAQRASGQALSRRVQKHKRTQDPRAGAFRIRGA